MPINYSYPVVNPTLNDVLLGTDRENENQTVNFTISSIVALVDASTGTGTVTSVNGLGSKFVKVTGGPITESGALTVSLSATGTPSETTFLRGDNKWAELSEIVPSGVGIYDNGSLVTENVSSINITGDAATVSRTGNDVTINIESPDQQTGIQGIVQGTGISVSTTSNVATISNTGVTQIVAGNNITISPTNGKGIVTINSTGGGSSTATNYAAGDGLKLIPVSGTMPLPEFAIEHAGSNNYIAVGKDDAAAAPADYLAFNQLSSGDVKTMAFQDINIDMLTDIKDYLTNTYITGNDSEGFVKYTTDTYDSIDNAKYIVTLTDAEYTALATKDPNTIYMTVTTAPTTYTVTMDLVDNIIDPSGVGYTLIGDLDQATRTGSQGSSYSFSTQAVLSPGYQFASGFPFFATNPNGSIPGSNTNVTQTLTGTIEAIPNVVTATLNVDTSYLILNGAQKGVDWDITGDDTGASSSGNAPHSYSFNSGITILNTSEWQWQSGPTVVPTQPLTGTTSNNITVNTKFDGVLTRKQGEATLTIVDNITGGVEGVAYTINVDAPYTQTGNVGATFEWNVTVTAIGGFTFSSGPNYNPGQTISGTFTETTQGFTLTLTGSVAAASPCTTTTFIGASAGATIDVVYCDGETATLTQGVDDLSGVCIQTGEYTVTSGTITDVAAVSPCSVPQRHVYTLVDHDSTSFTDVDNGTINTSNITTMYLDTALLNTATRAYSTPNLSTPTASGFYTNCYDTIIYVDGSGNVSATLRSNSLIQKSRGQLYNTADDACNNSASGTTVYVPELSLSNVNSYVFSSPDPNYGFEFILWSNKDETTNKYTRFSSASESVEIGSGSNIGRIISNSSCTQQYTYSFAPCPNQAFTNTFVASSDIQLTPNAVYTMTGGTYDGVNATLLGASTGTPVAVVGVLNTDGCPPPTLTAIYVQETTTACTTSDDVTGPAPTDVIWIPANSTNLLNDTGDGNKLKLNNQDPYANTTKTFYQCNENYISTNSVVTNCTDYTQLPANTSYVVHGWSLIDPDPGHNKIYGSTTTTTASFNKCVANTVTLNIINNISGSSNGYSISTTKPVPCVDCLDIQTVTSGQIYSVSGNPGSNYGFLTTATTLGSYVWQSGPTYSVSQPQTGTVGNSSETLNLTISGSVYDSAGTIISFNKGYTYKQYVNDVPMDGYIKDYYDPALNGVGVGVNPDGSNVVTNDRYVSVGISPDQPWAYNNPNYGFTPEGYNTTTNRPDFCLSRVTKMYLTWFGTTTFTGWAIGITTNKNVTPSTPLSPTISADNLVGTYDATLTRMSNLTSIELTTSLIKIEDFPYAGLNGPEELQSSPMIVDAPGSTNLEDFPYIAGELYKLTIDTSPAGVSDGYEFYFKPEVLL